MKNVLNLIIDAAKNDDMHRVIELAEMQQDKFCDNNCVWTDHHPDCVRAEPEWYHGIDIYGCNRFYHKDEVRPSEFNTPLYTHPQPKAAVPTEHKQEPDVVMHPHHGTWDIINNPPKGIDDVALYYVQPKASNEESSADQEPVAWVDALFDELKHGDEDHQAWLYEKLKSWACTHPQPKAAVPMEHKQSDSVEPVATIRTWHKEGDRHAELLDWETGLSRLPDGEYSLYTSPYVATPRQPHPVIKPLTDEQLRKVQHYMVEGAYHYSFMHGARYAERYHGIKGEA